MPRVKVQRLEGGCRIAVSSPVTGGLLWQSPAMHWPPTPAGRLELKTAERHCPGLEARWLEREVWRQLRGR